MRGSASRIFGVKTFPKIRLIQSNERGLHLAGESYVIITGSEAMNQRTSSKREKQNATTIMRTKEAALVATLGLAVLAPYAGHAEHPRATWQANLHAKEDMAEVSTRGDIVNLPDPLKQQLVRLADRPHSQLPTQAYAEAHFNTAPFKPKPSQLFQYYLLDTTGFEPNPFTATFPGVNDTAMLTATAPNCHFPTIGTVRVVLEPKPGLPTDPNNVRAFIDIFTDIDGLFVINNESGWYEGWMIHDLRVAPVAAPVPSGRPQFGTITAADAAALAAMGNHNNVTRNIFTLDVKEVRFPSATDHFPDRQSNTIPIQLSMGAWNTLQQSDGHAYWEFNYTTNWIHPLYELPFTGGIPDTFEAGLVGALSSVVPGGGPSGVTNSPINYGDNPNTAGVVQASGPRDPAKFDAGHHSQPHFRPPFIPPTLANEIFLDVYERVVSFEPGVLFPKRLYDAYAAEIARVGHNGVVSAAEGDVDTASDGFANNERLFIPATKFNRFAVTREINDGLLAPRFAPSQRGWVLSVTLVPVNPSVPASEEEDSDDP